jgi:hypothetical protein
VKRFEGEARHSYTRSAEIDNQGLFHDILGYQGAQLTRVERFLVSSSARIEAPLRLQYQTLILVKLLGTAALSVKQHAATMLPPSNCNRTMVDVCQQSYAH